MKIGEVAAAADCDVATVRYYEKAGLMPAPERTSSNYRTYGPRHIERLCFIRRCRSLDMDLGEVRVLLAFVDEPDQGCTEVNEALDRHIAQVDAKMRELEELQGELKRLRRKCRTASSAASCGILGDLRTSRPRLAPKANRRTA